MKPKIYSAVIVVAALLASSALADEARVADYTAKFRSVRVTELSRETAKAVAGEKPGNRVAVAADAVTAALKVSGPSAPLVVGAVAKAAPETAPIAAGTAAKAQPALVGPITKAAVSAAPAEFEATLTALCKAQPASFYTIGVGAASAAPKSADKVLPVISAALPALKPLIARSQAQFAAAARPASLALVLKHTEDMLAVLSRQSKETPEALLTGQTETTMATQLSASAMLMPPPPVVLPPFVPGGGTPGEVVAGDTGTNSPSGRVYSAP